MTALRRGDLLNVFNAGQCTLEDLRLTLEFLSRHHRSFSPPNYPLLLREDGTLAPDWEAEQEHSRDVTAEINRDRILEQLKLAMESRDLARLQLLQLFQEFPTPEHHRNSITRIFMDALGIHGPEGIMEVHPESVKNVYHLGRCTGQEMQWMMDFLNRTSNSLWISRDRADWDRFKTGLSNATEPWNPSMATDNDSDRSSPIESVVNPGSSTAEARSSLHAQGKEEQSSAGIEDSENHSDGKYKRKRSPSRRPDHNDDSSKRNATIRPEVVHFPRPTSMQTNFWVD